jgi:hypothetical protein
MILCFPDLDTFRLVVTSTILPVAVTLSEAKAAVADDGRIFLDTPHKPTKKQTTDLNKLNVTAVRSMPGEPEAVASWLQVVPVTKDAAPPQLSSQAPVLFELSNAQDLPALVSEMLRLGNDRQSFRWVSADDGSDRRVLLRVIGPPYYTLLRALDHLTGGGGAPVRAYVEQAPRVWVEVGHTHPFAAQVKLPDDQSVLIRGPRSWTFLPEQPFRDVYEILQFTLPHAPTEWRPTDDPTKLTVPLRLVPGNATDAPELWVLRGDAVDQLDAFVKEADDRLTQRLRFAVADAPNGERILVLKVGSTRGTPPAVQLPKAVGYRAHSSLPNLFIPVGTRLHPQLRRDAVRGLLADDLDAVVWLTPTGDGSFTPESVPDAAFHPLEDWVDYVIETAHVPLKEWVESTRFDFQSFVCGDEKPPKPRDPGKGPKEPRGGKGGRDAEPLSGPTDGKKGGKEKGDGGPPVTTFVAEEVTKKKPNEWIAKRAELQAQFLAVNGALDHPDRLALWPALAVANAGAGDPGEAALCWVNALWEQDEYTPECVTGWAQTELPETNGETTAAELHDRLKQAEPTRTDARRLAAAVFALACQPKPPAWLLATLPDVQKYIETNEPKLSARVAWLVSTRLARLGGADVLGLARMRDRLLQRLLEAGLNPELDLPFFLRTAGLDDSERVRTVRSQMTDLHQVVRKWADAGSKQGNVATPVEGNPTAAYVDLMFAFGLAKLGSSQEATKTAEAARAALEKFSPDTDKGIAARFLYRGFKHRIDQAVAGQPAGGRLPPALYDDLDDINRQSKGMANSPHGMAHFVITRMQQQSKILEPYERPDPYKKFTVEHEGGLKKQLYELAAERDPARLAAKIRELYRAEEKKPDPKDKTRTPVVTDKQFDILLDCLPLSARCGGAFAAELIRLVPAALRQAFPQKADLAKKQGILLERGLFFAGHFDHRDLVTALVDAFAEVVAAKPDDQKYELINAVAGSSLRSLRKLGLRDEIDKLLKHLLDAVLGKATLKDLKAKAAGKHDQWLKALQTMLNIAGGWLTFGLNDQAAPILDEARAELLSPPGVKALLLENSRLAATYVATLGHGPAEGGLQRIVELFRKIDPAKITNSFTTAQFYSRLHLNVVEEVVSAVVSDDFALGTAGRRWLEDDEYLVRRRIHHDMRANLSGSGL